MNATPTPPQITTPTIPNPRLSPLACRTCTLSPHSDASSSPPLPGDSVHPLADISGASDSGRRSNPPALGSHKVSRAKGETRRAVRAAAAEKVEDRWRIVVPREARWVPPRSPSHWIEGA